MATDPLKLLAIDDNPSYLNALQAVVQDTLTGAIVLTAPNGPQGLACALAEDPDVILLDIVMPGMDGYEVCRRLKANDGTRHIPVVFLTAVRADRESRIRALEAGAEAFLAKPLDEVELTAQIRAMAKIKAANVQARQEKAHLAALVAARTAELEQELTERKRAETALRESNELLSMFVEHSPIFAFIKEVTPTESRVLKASENYLDMIGISGSEIVGKTMTELFPAEFAATISADDWAVVSEDKTLKLDEDLNGRNYTTIKFPIFQGGKHLLAGYSIDVTERKRAEAALSGHAAQLAALHETLLGITAQQELPILLQSIVERAVGLLDADAGGLYLSDAENRQCRCEVSYRTPRDYTGTLLKYGDGAAGTVALTGQPLMVDDYRTWSARAVVFEKDQPFQALIAVPIIWHEQVTGVIDVLRQGTKPFTKTDQDLLGRFAAHAAIAIEDARLLQSLQHELAERQRVEAALRESRAILQAAMDQGSAGIAIADAPDGVLRYVNNAGLLIRGGDRQTIVERIGIDQYVASWQLLDLDGSPLESDEVPLARAIRFGETCSREFIIRRDNNDDRIVLANAAPITDDAGKVVAGIVVFADITERKQTEATLLKARIELEKSERLKSEVIERLNEAQEVAKVGSWDWDLESNEVWWSAETYRLFGVRPEEYTPGFESNARFIHPDDLELYRSAFARSLETGEALDFDVRVVAGDGVTRYCRALGRCSYSEQGRPKRFIGTLTDNSERKHAQIALQQSERHLSHIVNTISDITYSCLADADGNYVLDWLAGTVEQTTGYTAAEITARRCWRFLVIEEDIAVFESQVMGLRPGASASCELRLRRKDGGIAWVKSFAECIADEKQPARQRMYGGLLDITEQKCTEMALREREADLAEAQRIAQMGSYRFDIAANTVSWSEELYRIFDVEKSAFDRNYESYLARVHPDDKPDVLETSRKARETGEPFEAEYRITAHAGQCRIIREIGYAQRDDTGQVVSLFGVVQDITERKWAEMALRESEEKFRALMTLAPAGIYLTTPEGRCTYANARWCEMAGLALEEALGDGWVQGLHPDDRGAVRAAWEQLAAGKGLWDLEYRFRTRDGQVTWVHGLATPQRDPSGKITSYIGINQDITERKKAEEALRASQQLIEGVVNAMPVRVFWKDKNFNYLGCNAAFAADAGFTAPQDIIGKDDYQMGWRAQADLYRDADRQVIESGRPVLLLEQPQTTPEGHTMTVLASKIPLRDVRGEISGVLGTYLDITERKRTETALRESEARYGAFIDATSDMVYVKDDELRHVVANRALGAFLGREPAEIIGRTDAELMSAHAAETCRFSDLQTLQKGSLVVSEEPIGDRTYETTKFPVPLQSGKTGLGGIIRDITERKRAETERQTLFEIMQGLTTAENLQAYLGLVHHAIAKVVFAENFFVVLKDKDTGFFEEVYAVDQYDALSPPALLEKSICAYVFRSGEPLLLSQARFAELAARGEVELVGADSPSWLGVPLITSKETIGVMVVQDYEGANRYSERDKEFLVSIAGQVAQIVERKRAEEEIRQLNAELEQRVAARTAQLQATNKELEAFAYSVSHDLRAPLRGIDGWSQALLEDYYEQLDDQARVYLNRVRAEAQRMGGLIDALLQLSRVTRVEKQKRPVDLSALAHTVMAQLRANEPERQAEVLIQPGLTAYGDPRLLELVLTNLLDNAWKFTGPRPQTRIEFGRIADFRLQTPVPEAERRGISDLSGSEKSEMAGTTGHAVGNQKSQIYYVRDNGVGFDMTYAQRLFGAFQRMHAATEFPGTGIGLATVQRIVQRHGGRTWAEAVVDGGATFYFTLEEAV